LKIKGKTPDGKRGIDIAISGDADVKVKNDTVAFNVDVEYDRSGGASEFKFSGSTEKKWTHPLGIGFLDLDSLTLNIDKKAGSYDVEMTAKTDIGSHSRLDVTVDIHEKNGRITDAFFGLKGPLKLSDIPGVKDIPNSNHFTIDTIKVSEHGVEAKTDFGGKKDLDAFLFTGSGWNLILRQDNFAITEIVPPLKNTPLRHVVLSEAAVVLSKDGLQGALSSFSPIAQDALKDIYGAGAANIDVESGLSLIAAFEHKKSKGGMADAMSRLGLSEERVILMGDIGGLFGGPTKLDVEVDLSAHTGAKSQPKWMTAKPGVEAVFSMIATETAGQFDIEIGIGADIVAKVKGTELVFAAKTALEFQDEKIDVKIAADLKDKKGWKHPFGIPGFTLYEVGFDLGITEDGAIHLGFDGSINVDSDKFKVAADADLLPEALGAPEHIAFIGSADKVDMFFMEAIAIDMLGGNFKLDIPGGILPTFTGVKFAFVTPGAQDPDLNITGEGFALKGAMNWLDHEVGSMDIAVNPTKGIVADAKIDNFDLGPLTLTNNDFHLKAGIKGLPSLKVDSDIELFGISERFNIAFDKTGVTFDALVKLGPDISMQTDFKLTGIDISAKKPSFKNADFYMAGDLKMDIGKFISGPAEQSLIDLTTELNADFVKAKTALKAASKKVNGLTTKINAERAKVRKQKAAAEAVVQNAENRVNGLNARLAGQWNSYHSCHGWHKWPCRIREGIHIGWTKTELGVADGALKLAKSAISHFPIDLDPRVAVLIGERDAAKGALYLAEKAVEGADALDWVMKALAKEMKKGLDNKGIANSINIKKAAFKGDLQGIIKHDTPVDLAMDVELFGAEIKDSFSFKLKDIAYDVEQVGMLGLYAIEHLIEKGVTGIPGPLKTKLRGALATKMDAKDASRKRELAKYQKDFSATNKTAQALQNKYAAYNTASLEAELAKSRSPLDPDTTETFANELIEVGHTGLCLTHIGGGAIEEGICANAASQRWSTRPASGATNVKPGAGYVFIYQPSGGDCIAPEGNWVNVKQTFSDPKLPTEGSFTFMEPQFQGDGKIIVKGCVNSKEYYWKVLKHGNGWMQMANLATNQCLHFKNSSAFPGVANAEWAPCTGAANQVYRIADNATPKYHADNIIIRSDPLGLCIGAANAKGEVPMTACANASRFDYSVDIRGFVKFINRANGKCLQPSSYAHGAKMIEVACTQLDYQWWQIDSQPGGVIIHNAQTKLCTEPPQGISDVPATQQACNASRNAILSPVQDNSGPTWKTVSPSSFPSSGVFNASFTRGEKAPQAVWNRHAQWMNAHERGVWYFRRFNNPTWYPTDPAMNICVMVHLNSWMSGVVENKKCKVQYNDVVYYSTGNYRLLMTAPGSYWRPNKGGGLQADFIPTGYFAGSGTVTMMYACRTIGIDDQKTHIGYTIDGKQCRTSYAAHYYQPHFEVLSRSPASHFELKLTN
jgi:hypothetical protein